MAKLDTGTSLMVYEIRHAKFPETTLLLKKPFSLKSLRELGPGDLLLSVVAGTRSVRKIDILPRVSSKKERLSACYSGHSQSNRNP